MNLKELGKKLEKENLVVVEDDNTLVVSNKLTMITIIPQEDRLKVVTPYQLTLGVDYNDPNLIENIKRAFTLDLQLKLFTFRDLESYVKVNVVYNDSTIYFGYGDTQFYLDDKFEDTFANKFEDTFANKMYVKDNKVYLNGELLHVLQTATLLEFFEIFMQGLLITKTHEECKELITNSIITLQHYK